jgi:dihydroorotase
MILFKNVILADTNSLGWLLVDGNFIIRRGTGMPDAEIPDAEIVDGEGRTLMAGAIDVHVHFREPGLTHKADIASESRAAVAGGVTSFVDMPNTVPQTTTVAALDDKMERAARTSVANYGFFIGATNSNLDTLLSVDPTRVAGVKLFLGSSTGNMLVDSAGTLDALFSSVKLPISVHAEDEATIATQREMAVKLYGEDLPIKAHTFIRPVEACVSATERAIDLAERHGAHLHIAHVTTADEVEMIRRARARGVNITCEVSPHHLLWCDEDYDRLGSRIKMNPSVKSRTDRDALRSAVADGTIDIIATDHAPHTVEEKQGTALTAMSGAPMVQFSLTTMLDMFGVETVNRTMCARPAEIFKIDRRGKMDVGCHADLVLVDMNAPHVVTDSDVISRCGWTPINGLTVKSAVVATWVNGECVYKDATITDSHAAMALKFNH